jgi:hypothetical protein
MQWPEFDWEFKPAVQARGPAIRVVLAGFGGGKNGRCTWVLVIFGVGGLLGSLSLFHTALWCNSMARIWDLKFVSHCPLV